MVNYDRRFCNNFADATLPLIKQLKKRVLWEWKDKHEKCFNDIKELYLKTTLVEHPDFGRIFYSSADSSGYGIGACLFQFNGEGERNVIAYASRT